MMLIRTNHLLCLAALATRTIWIVGSSIIFWASDFAARNQFAFGTNLGLEADGYRVRWFGYRGMRWEDLMLRLNQQLWADPMSPPDVLILHLGANNLGSTMSHVLEHMIRSDLLAIKARLPNCHLIWSSMLPRRCWRNVVNVHAIERARSHANRCAIRQVIFLGGGAIKYRLISTEDGGTYRGDGVHLADIGQGIFLATLQSGIRQILLHGMRVYE